MTRQRSPSSPIILVHGGAGSRPMTAAQGDCLGEALRLGHERLSAGAPALEAVEAAIRVLEGSGLFNAGAGSRLQLDGIRRMDASLMAGRRLEAGAVAGIEGIRHPITAARLVMEETAHVLLAGPPATRFARHFKLERLAPPDAAARRTLQRECRSRSGPLAEDMRRLLAGMARRRKAGLETVGAVALDRSGSLAAGASTGGVALMLPGRVGDTPLIGAGVYADDEAGAVSMTGIGEGIIRLAMAKAIVERLRRGAPAAALREVLADLAARVKGAAGALALAVDGRFAIRHNTPYMAAGYRQGRGRPVIRARFAR